MKEKIAVLLIAVSQKIQFEMGPTHVSSSNDLGRV